MKNDTIPDFAVKAVDEFNADQQAYAARIAQNEAQEQRKLSENQFVVTLRERLWALYERSDLTEGVRGRAYALWVASGDFVNVRMWTLPGHCEAFHRDGMEKTKLRPEYPVTPVFGGGYRVSPSGVFEHNAGWLYRIKDWADAVERQHDLGDI